MTDRMTIVGKDGESKYLVDEQNRITDLRDAALCHCTDENRPTQQTGEQLVCLVCGLPITKPQEEI